MRGIVNARRDPEEEQRKAEEASIRFAKEEEERTRRLARKKMEEVDDPAEGSGFDDDELLSDFQSRVASINADSDADAEADALSDDKQNMRNSPVPDRGTGSMLMERPDESSKEGDDESGDERSQEPNKPTSDPDSLELLNRMWKLDSPDEKDRK